MQVNFIGHGLNPTNEFTVGNILATSFNENKFNRFLGFVAFASIAGVKKIMPSILENNSNFNTLTFFIGIDENGTSKEALQELIENNIETFIFNTRSAMIYHPKIFLFEGDIWTRLIIGSTNLTNSGLFVNVEGAIMLDYRKSDSQGKKLSNQVKSYFSQLIDKTHSNVEKLNSSLLEKLTESGLVTNEISQILNKNQNKEELSIFPELEILNSNQIKLGNLEFSDEEESNKNRNIEFTKNDLEKFPIFFEKWLNYKIEFPKSGGLVNRDTEDRSLYHWFRKIKNLASKQKDIPQLILKQLVENNFPFDDGKLIQSRIRWNERFEELKDYAKNNNQKFAHVPQHKNPKHPFASLGQWCAHQKQRRKVNQPPTWTEYEENKMNSINFKWETPNIGGGTTLQDELWLENYFKLEVYKQLTGNANPSQTDEDLEIRKLAKWVNDQRTLQNNGRKLKTGRTRHLIKERYDLLIELGVDFDYQLNKRKAELEKFISGYLELRKIYPDEKPTRGDNRFSEILAKKSEIRFRYKNDTSDANKWRIERLNEIKFSWE